MADLQTTHPASKPRIAVQLYTVRDLLAQDFVGTLRKVREIGYTHVELAGYGPFTAVELKKVLTDAGLSPCSTHCPIDRLEQDINHAIEDALALNVAYLVCPYLPEDRRSDEKGWRRCADILNLVGQTCRQHRIQLCYHNHSFEFVRIGNRYALDLLFDQTEPANLHAELDTYWIKYGGAEPVDYIRKLSGRCPLIHLKDMAADEKRSFAEVGSGILDFKAIFTAAESAGSVWGVVEQDVCPGNPLDSIETSLYNLRQMGHA